MTTKSSHEIFFLPSEELTASFVDRLWRQDQHVLVVSANSTRRDARRKLMPEVEHVAAEQSAHDLRPEVIVICDCDMINRTLVDVWKSRAFSVYLMEGRPE